MTWMTAHEVRVLVKSNALRRSSWPVEKVYYVNVNPLLPILIPTDEDLHANDWEVL